MTLLGENAQSNTVPRVAELAAAPASSALAAVRRRVIGAHGVDRDRARCRGARRPGRATGRNSASEIRARIASRSNSASIARPASGRSPQISSVSDGRVYRDDQRDREQRRRSRGAAIADRGAREPRRERAHACMDQRRAATPRPARAAGRYRAGRCRGRRRSATARSRTASVATLGDRDDDPRPQQRAPAAAAPPRRRAGARARRTAARTAATPRRCASAVATRTSARGSATVSGLNACAARAAHTLWNIAPRERERAEPDHREPAGEPRRRAVGVDQPGGELARAATPRTTPRTTTLAASRAGTASSATKPAVASARQRVGGPAALDEPGGERTERTRRTGSARASAPTAASRDRSRDS